MNPERTMKIWTIPSVPTLLAGVVARSFAIGSRRKRGRAMNKVKMTLVTTVVAAAFGLALGLIGAPAQAHHQMGHDKGGDGGGGGEGAVTTIPIRVEIGGVETIQGDGRTIFVNTIFVGDSLGGLAYANGEGGVQADAGPGIRIAPTGHGKKPTREIKVELRDLCVKIPFLEGEIDYTEGCEAIPGKTFLELRDQVVLAVRAYTINCPDGIDGECPDAFTILPGDSTRTLMGFTVFFDGGQTRLDIASDIGGHTAKSPGLCLNQMTQNDLGEEAIKFLDDFCIDSAGNRDDGACNVKVEAEDTDGDPNLRNDYWKVTADGATGLICGSVDREFVVYGMVDNVTFLMEAFVK